MPLSANGKPPAIVSKRCGAKTRSGKPCRQWAMPNGRCKMHGGKSIVIHGRYSVAMRRSLSDKLERFEQAPVDDLTNELAMLRALTDEYLSRFETGIKLSANDMRVLGDFLESVGRMTERISKIRNSTALTAAEVKLLQSGLLAVLAKYVPRDELPNAIRDLRATISVS